MGAVKAKPAARAEKAAAKQAKKDAKRAKKLSRPPSRKPKEENRKARGRALTASIPLSELNVKTAAGRATEALSHVKWTALFKKHLGILESHVKSLDRVMSSLKTFMAALPEQECAMWERGEVGKWGMICGLMDRARDTLASARVASAGLVPEHSLRDKKGLGLSGTSFERYLPKVEALAKAAGLDTSNIGGKPKAKPTTDYDGDSEMEDAPILGDDPNADSDSSSDSAKSGCSIDESVDKKETVTMKKSDSIKEVEPNPYFVVDTEPTPVAVKAPVVLSTKNGKKRAKDDEGGEKKAKKARKSDQVAAETIETAPQPESPNIKEEASASDVNKTKKDKKKRRGSEDGESRMSKKAKKDLLASAETETETVVASTPVVDFNAIHAQIQAEVDAAEKTKAAETKAKKDRKRRRSSDSVEKEGGNSKEENGESSKDKKRKVDGDEIVKKKKKRKDT